jgi:long-chain acyl-CoA synthetase
LFGFLNRREGVAIRHQAGALTYAELNRLITLLGERLLSFGLKPGDRVAAVLPNSLELMISYYACLLKGLIIAPVNERLTNREARAILDHCRPSLLLATPSNRSRFSDLEMDGGIEALSLVGIHEWLDEDIGNPEEASLQESASSWPRDHPGILFYTSGSTGAPKGVLYTHRTLIDNERIFRVGLEVTAQDHSVVCHCMASNFMFSQLTVPFLHVGGTVEIVDFGSVEQTLRAVEAGATFFSVIPWFGSLLVEAARGRVGDHHRVRVCGVGGDRVPLSFHEEFTEVFGVMPREFLGMTETNVFTVNPQDEERIRVGSVGLPLPEVNVEVRDPHRQPRPLGEEGEIWTHTPGRMEEYWGDPEKTSETIVDGWVATGDAGYLDEEGYLWLSGRIKHIVICDGDNVHPGEVEREMAQHPAVDQVCVFGVQDERRGETVAAAVTLSDPDISLTLLELVAYLEDRLAETKIPKDLLLLDTLPQTANGKLDRQAMVDMVMKQRSTG